MLEGLDGSGTTTQAKLLSNYLFEKDKGNVITLTREPTMLTKFGREIRRRLKGELLPDEKVVHDFKYWVDLYYKDRKWHINKIVKPAIKRNQIVISDRYWLSSAAYQSTQEGGESKYIFDKHKGMLNPDLTIFLKVTPNQISKRFEDRKREYFEVESTLIKVAKNYEYITSQMARQHNIVIIDGSKSIEEVAKMIQNEIDKIL